MKYTEQLTTLVNQNEDPKLILKFIYLHVYQLINENNLSALDKYIYPLEIFYNIYYKEVVEKSGELWLKTIFPPYINGYNNFYRGIAGRLEYFHANLDDRDNYEEFYNKEVSLRTPDTYYWYGNPRNWSYCYAIKLDEEKEISMSYKKFLILEDENQTGASLDAENSAEYGVTEKQILLVRKTSIDSDPEDFDPYIYPTRIYYRGNEDAIKNKIEKYKENVTKENGYSPEIAKIWDEYNEKKETLNELNLEKMTKYCITYKALSDKEQIELKLKFKLEYQNKIELITNEIDAYEKRGIAKKKH